MKRQVESMLRGGQFRQLLESYIKRIRDKYDLKKTEVEVLYYFANAGDNNTSKDVTNYLHMNKGHISTTMDALCQKGLLVSRQDSNDKRIVHYTITDQAREMENEINDIINRLNKELFEGVPTEDREAFERVAVQIGKNIEIMKKEM